MELPEIEEDKKVGSLYSKTDLQKAMSEFFNDILPRMDFVEDHFWTNIRIILCMICCSFGCYAQFGLKFPKDSLPIGMCVLGYFAFTGLVSLIDFFCIKTSVICIKLGDESVFVDVNMQQFSSEVELGLRSSKRNIKNKVSVGKYFESDGYLAAEALHADFVQLVKKFTQQQAQGEKGDTKKNK